MELTDLAELIRLRLIVNQTFKGGKGSGNFGHAGRPGEIGGSAAGNSLVYSKRFDIYEINDASDIADRYVTIAVAKRGENLGKIYASKDSVSHNEMVTALGGSIDDYVRFTSVDEYGRGFRESKGRWLSADILYSATNLRESNFESKAINNIFEALNRIVYKGLDKNTKVEIFTNKIKPIITTAKEFIEVNQ